MKAIAKQIRLDMQRFSGAGCRRFKSCHPDSEARNFNVLRILKFRIFYFQTRLDTMTADLYVSSCLLGGIERLKQALWTSY